MSQEPYVLYDSATSKFKPIAERSDRLQTLSQLLAATYQNGDAKSMRILLSSTSYTPDEDFMVLVRALKLIDDNLKNKLLVLVTGKGPLKEHYRLVFQECNRVLKNVSI